MDLKEQMKFILGKDRRSSLLTQIKNRGNIARLCDVIQMKYGLQRIHHLKSKHIVGAFDDLKAKGLGNSSLAAYCTAARIIAASIGKQNIVPRTNRELGISRAGDRLKPIAPSKEKIAEITDTLRQKAEWLGLASEMRQQFGLRSKESLLSNQINEQGQLLVRGAKGGRPRSIDVRTPEQRDLIRRVHRYIEERGQTSLIPKEMTLKQGLKCQANAVHRAGGTKANCANPHASRHGYAQDRVAEGVSREQISQDLGHGREDVIAHYVK